jgi:hypothetical protein
MIVHSFHFDLFADYFQFYLQDDDVTKGSLADAWTEEATQRFLAVVPHAIGVGTVRNMTVPVLVVFHDTRPEIDFSVWDHVTLASLQVDTGRIVIAGCTDYFPNAARIEVIPGVYEALICYGNLDTVSENGLTGEDHYEMNLFLGSSIEPKILKQFKSPE